MKGRRVTLAGNEVAVLRREALRLDHVAEDLREGRPIETLARRLEAAAETLRYLLDRAEQRGTVH